MMIDLNSSEALVLFDWLLARDSNPSVPIDPAAEKVLWKIEAHLERELVEPFQSDYKETVEKAKAIVLT